MSVLFYRESPGKFDSRTLSRETLSRWTGRIITANVLLLSLLLSDVSSLLVVVVEVVSLALSLLSLFVITINTMITMITINMLQYNVI